MILIPRSIIVMSLLVHIPYMYTQTETVVSSGKVALVQLSDNVEKLIDALAPQELTRAEIHQQITTILIDILDKNNKQPVHGYLNQINKLLQLLNKDNKFNFNPVLNSYFAKLTPLNPGPRNDFLKKLPEQTQNDLKDKEIFEALRFFIKNKEKQNPLLHSLFWIEADKTHHFLRVFNRLLPKHLQVDSIYPLLDRINHKK